VKDIPMDSKHPSYAVLEQTGNRLRSFRDQQVLLLWGMRDFCFSPYFLNRWKEFFPTSRIVEFADAGHFLFEEKAPECIREIREHFRHNSPETLESSG
jgi:cis-3-alkyl-4-acyloxetan-2-one decarboxylase